MPGTPLRAVLATAVAAAVAISGCGLGDDGETIPEANADQLLSRLDAVQTNVNGGNCELAREQAEEFSAAVDALPAGVDEEVESGLRQAAERLVQLTGDESECLASGATGATGAETTTVETPPPTTTEETTTTTEPETTTEEPPEEEQEEEPEEDGPPGPPSGAGNSGNGNGGGVGATGGIGGGGG